MSGIINDSILADAPLIRGFRILDPVVLFDRLGSGGFGAVYRGRHLRFGFDVAVKCLHRSLADDDEVIARFQREASIAAAITSENLVRAFEISEVGDINYMVMEFIRGESGRERVARKRQLSIEEACTIVHQAAKGLEMAHIRGVVHRDVKPENIMISTGGDVKVADLGLAKAKDEFLETKPRRSLGTPVYMPPEQFRDVRSMNPAGDVYSLASSLYFFLAGKNAIADGPAIGVAYQVSEVDFPDIRELRSGVPGRLAEIIAACTRKDPSTRPQNAGELAKMLAPFSDVEAPSRRLRDEEAEIEYHERSLVAAAPSREILQEIKSTLSQSGGAFAIPSPHDAETIRGNDLSTVDLNPIEDISSLDLTVPSENSKRIELDPERRSSVSSSKSLHSGQNDPRRSQRDSSVVEEKRETRTKASESVASGRTWMALLAVVATLSAGWYVLDGNRERDSDGRPNDVVSEVESLVDDGSSSRRIRPRAPRKDDSLTNVGKSDDDERKPSTRPEFESFTFDDANEQGFGEYRLVKDPSIVFVFVPGGVLTMGASDNGNSPSSSVTLSPFLISKFELTVKQFRRFTEAKGVTPPSGEIDDEPVACVSYVDAVGFCEWAGLELPTEAQWEFAARGRDGRNYPWGESTSDGAKANSKGDDDGFSGLAPAHAFASAGSPFGTVNQAGNVAEWCRDWETPFSDAAREGDGFRSTPGTGVRIVKGGSFKDRMSELRSAERRSRNPLREFEYLGFRPSMTIPPPK